MKQLQLRGGAIPFLAAALLAAALGISSCSDDAAAKKSDAAEPDLILSGRLTDPATGEGLANATVELSGSLSAKLGAASAGLLARGNLTQTDAQGFYSIKVSGGAKVHTFKVTDSGGNVLGVFQIKISSDNAVAGPPTIVEGDIAASIPVVTVLESGQTELPETVAIDVDGTYAATTIELEMGGQSQTMEGSTMVVRSKKVIFGEIRGSAYSEKGDFVVVPLAGMKIVFACENTSADGVALKCVGGPILIEKDDGQEPELIDRVTFLAEKTDAATAVPNGSLNYASAVTADGIISTDWGAPSPTASDPAGDAGGTVSADIQSVYAGYNVTNKIMAFAFVLDAAPAVNMVYVVKLRNDDYSEIRFVAEKNSSMEKMSYRVNDSGDDQTPGGNEGDDYGFYMSGTTVEFWLNLETATTGIDTSKLDDVEIRFSTYQINQSGGGGPGNSDKDVVYPVAHYDFTSMTPP